MKLFVLRIIKNFDEMGAKFLAGPSVLQDDIPRQYSGQVISYLFTQLFPCQNKTTLLANPAPALKNNLI